MSVLKQCYVCDGKVSSAANACPHCGHPFKERKRSTMGKAFTVLWTVYGAFSAVNILLAVAADRNVIFSVPFYLWVMTIILGVIAISMRDPVREETKWEALR